MGVDSYHVLIHAPMVQELGTEESFRKALDELATVGFETLPGRGMEKVSEYRTAEREGDSAFDEEFHEVDSVLNELDEAGGGYIGISYNGMNNRFKISENAGWTESEETEIRFPEIQLQFWKWAVNPGEDDDPEQIDDRCETVLDAACRLAELFHAEYVHITSTESMVRQLPSESISQEVGVRWFTILGEELLPDFGGKNAVIETPACRTEELESGAILIAARKRAGPGVPHDTSAENYLQESYEQA